MPLWLSELLPGSSRQPWTLHSRMISRAAAFFRNTLQTMRTAALLVLKKKKIGACIRKLGACTVTLNTGDSWDCVGGDERCIPLFCNCTVEQHTGRC